MQTFLPYPDYEKSMRSLDTRRLGKQRIEAWRILLILLKHEYRDGALVPAVVRQGYSSHPAVVQWQGYEWQLLKYFEASITEWKRRGYRNGQMDIYVDALYKATDCVAQLILTTDRVPWWLGNRKYHKSHKSNLLRKNHRFYSAHKWSVESDLPYWWPAQQNFHQGVTHAV